MNSLRISLVNDRTLAIMLTISMLVWGLGLTSWIGIANAAMIETASDVLVDSDLSASTDHTITYTSPTAIANGSTITVTFPAGFVLTDVDNAEVDLYDDGVSEGTPAADCVAADAVSAAVAGQVLTLTYCAGDAGAAAAGSVMRIRIGTNADGAGVDQIENPAAAASYVISIGGTQTDSGDMRVAIIDDVSVSATVPTSLTFTVAGVAAATANANSEAGTTDVTTTATSIPWGTLAADTRKEASQTLTVATNATNGFTVTVYQDGDLTNGSGDTINLFDDGANGAAKAWEAPTDTLVGGVDGYGHQGITSEDSSLVGGDTFGAALYDAIGSSASPLEVFYSTTPADGATAHVGATQLGFSIEVGDLQESGNDYAQVLTYVATPIF